MSLQPGDRIGPYEILGPLGAGGMGEVFRARDPRLDREVAIKVLPESFETDLERRQRFDREARTAGGLNHPGLLTVFEIAEHEGRPYLVTELLEGRTLGDRLREGPLPIRRALEIAAEVARALAAVHDRGIVHRDLKPENLFLTLDGRTKILDFGLAKPPRLDQSLDEDAATHVLQTESGMILGTIGYMAPEQAKGGEVSPGSDIFSLGAVTYEMLTGEKAFRGESAVDTLHAILRSEPPTLASLRPDVHPLCEPIVRRCLEKEPGRRYRSALDLAFQLETLAKAPSSSSMTAPPPLRSARGPWIFGLVTALIVATAAIAMVWLRPRPEPPRPSKTTALTFSGRDRQPDLSPDDSTLVFASTRDGQERIWIKRLPGGAEIPLTEATSDFPRFSPDGSEVLFARDGALWRIGILGGASRKVVDNARLGAWAPSGQEIVFVRAEEMGGTSIHTVDIDGANEQPLLKLADRVPVNLTYSEDGRKILLAILFFGVDISNPAFGLIDVATGQLEMIPATLGGLQPVALDWTTDGQSVVLAQPTGSTHMGSDWQLVEQDLESAAARPLLYLPESVSAIRIRKDGDLILEATSLRASIIYVEPWGTTRERKLTGGRAIDRQPSWSGDGSRFVFSSNRAGDSELWSYELDSGEIQRLTQDPGTDRDPVLSRDERHLLWSSDRSGNFEIWSAETDGRNPRQLSHDGVDAESPSISADGSWIVYASGNPDTTGILKIRADGTDETLIVSGPVAVPELSPDGRFASYIRQVGPGKSRLEIVRTEDGSAEPFLAECTLPPAIPLNVLPCRARWFPDGSALAFLSDDGDGRLAIWAQDFVAGEQSADTRRILYRPIIGDGPESFDINAEGALVLEVGTFEQTILLVDLDS